ncbi:MAG TPA: hypothetical protein VEJ37_11565 [Xanthobacteraceae bacterium]|nr:hypothetical protein [Xanthobacteraceae bacterium]
MIKRVNSTVLDAAPSRSMLADLNAIADRIIARTASWAPGKALPRDGRETSEISDIIALSVENSMD